ncbi:MAG: cell division protein FtsA [Pseudomonadota bacterium]
MARAEHRLRARAAARGGIVAALDIGCSKIACLIARQTPDTPGGFEFLGGGRQQSRGFTGGAITDLDGLERAVRLAVEDAERQAGERIEHVTLGVAGPTVDSRLVAAGVEIGGRQVTAKDVDRVQTAALAKAADKSKIVLSAHVVAYRIDGQEGVRDPRGMHADKLGVLISVVSAPKSLVRNFEECLGRAHLGVEGLAPAAIASGVGALIEDERDNGAICIDMGAGVTSIAVFLNGAPAWIGFAPSGGGRVTADIAQGLGTTFAAAERLKTVCGTVDFDGPGSAERIEAPRLGDDGRLETAKLPRKDLARVIAPRVEETLELVRDRLEASALRKVLPRRSVLTGGASQIPGLRDLAASTLGMPVRIGRPAAAEILGESFASPAFSTASGLLAYRSLGLFDASRAGAASLIGGGRAGGGLVNGTYRWLKENF